MNKLRITSKGFAGFTGTLGQVRFEDGVSVEPQSQIIANRLGSIMSVEFVDDEGESQGVAGIATHMLANRDSKLTDTAATVLVTAAEKKAEEMAEALKARPVTEYHTHEQLVEIADEGGIKGLRKIGDLWKVKGRGIPELIADILKAQSEHRERFAPAADPVEVEPNTELPDATETSSQDDGQSGAEDQADETSEGEGGSDGENEQDQNT